MTYMPSPLLAQLARGVAGAGGTLKRALDAAMDSVAVQVLGDSTGNDSDEWVAELSESLAATYPAWTVQRRLWDDATQAYAAPVTVQTGVGGERYLDCSTGTTTRQLPAAVSSHLSGVIDVRVKMQFADWTPGAQQNMVGKSGTAGNRSWYFSINAAGVPLFIYSTDGTALTTVFGTAAAGITDGTTSWLRAVFTPDDGGGNKTTTFYKSTDGITWTQIGATVSTAGTVTLFDAASWGYEVGGTVGGVMSTQPKVYEVSISAGGSNPSIVPALPEFWPRYNASAAVVVGAPVLTFVNGSHPGAGISYLGDATRLPKMTPYFHQLLTFVSTSHNETNAVGEQWIDRYATFVGQVRSAVPTASIVAVSQNPERSGSAWHLEHNARQLTLDAYARASGLTMLDVYSEFLAHAAWETDYMTDDVHPSAAGSTVWASLAMQMIDDLS